MLNLLQSHSLLCRSYCIPFESCPLPVNWLVVGMFNCYMGHVCDNALPDVTHFHTFHLLCTVAFSVLGVLVHVHCFAMVPCYRSITAHIGLCVLFHVSVQ